MTWPEFFFCLPAVVLIAFLLLPRPDTGKGPDTKGGF